MRNGVEKGIVLLITSDLADEEDSVEREAGDDQGKENDPDHKHRDLANVQQDPADIQDDGDGDQADARNKEEYRCLSPTHR